MVGLLGWEYRQAADLQAVVLIPASPLFSSVPAGSSGDAVLWGGLVNTGVQAGSTASGCCSNFFFSVILQRACRRQWC